ncbi:hypothetical protein BER2_3403 [plant metagenome]|uniref:Branched-chain amino acid transport n=1 Tax=plant metagenome TaxID=1297885 RepID=A0A484R9B0_9ZZZZ
MKDHLMLIVALCGAGTFLLRLLPLWQARRRRDVAATDTLRQRRLAGIGPAAIAALLAVSVWGEVGDAPSWTAGLRLAAAFLVVWAVKRWRSGTALPTLMGALAYGLMAQWLG